MEKHCTMIDKKGTKATLYCGDALEFYSTWPRPTVIISDGPYGVGGFRGDPHTPEELAEWYEPHAKAWAEATTSRTTLWFWGTEIGWASVHPVLKKNGWSYVRCNIWDKGLKHVAGNSNTRTLHSLPVVTEVCVQYVRTPSFTVGGEHMEMRDWLRGEWKRTRLPWREANKACGVKDAATRKYLDDSWLWYAPPAEAFGRLVEYANEHGAKDGAPYFSVNGHTPLTAREWQLLKPVFRCPSGITNVWQQNPLNGVERLKNGLKALHLNQKPLALMRLLVDTSSDIGDTVWEPFGGLFSGSLAALELQRNSFAAEVTEAVYDAGVARLRSATDLALF